MRVRVRVRDVPLREGTLDDLLGLGEHLLGEIQGRYRGNTRLQDLRGDVREI